MISGNQQLIFSLGDELYGFSLTHVKEVIGMMEITLIPDIPPYVKGIINLRNVIIPIIDLRAKLKMPLSESNDLSCIIIVETEISGKSRRTGMIVDGISEVIEIAQDCIEPPPAYTSSDVDLSYIINIAKIKEKVVMLLSAEKIVSEGVKK